MKPEPWQVHITRIRRVFQYVKDPDQAFFQICAQLSTRAC